MKLLPLAPLGLVLGACQLTLTPRDMHWQPVNIEALRTSSMRGISAPTDTVIWISGSEGRVVRSLDGGASFDDVSPDVARSDELDLRSICSIGGDRAWVASAGPGEASRILATINGGASWVEQHRNLEPAGFFDSIAFWDERNGIVLGDMVDGCLTILRTEDGGSSWTRVPRESLPPSVEGEAAFAASNGSIALFGEKRAWIGTGGSVARVLHTKDGGRNWEQADSPMRQGDAAAGIFALAFRTEVEGVSVGGMYTSPTATEGTSAFTTDGGKTWQLSPAPPRGYRSSVKPVPNRVGLWIAVGINGTDVSLDNGRTWQPVGSGSDEELNAVALSPSGSTAWAVGPKGSVRRMEL